MSRKLAHAHARVTVPAWNVEAPPATREGLAGSDIELCYQYVIEDPSVDVRMLVDG